MPRDQKRLADWKAKNKEKLDASKKAWRDKNPDYPILHKLKSYGLTPETFQALLDSQGGACAICRSPHPHATNWSIDHDHVTGKVRGILCMHCNVALGHMRDRPDFLRAAANYLEAQS